eukprot:8883054-Karenia_brevis.AAC.1
MSNRRLQVLLRKSKLWMPSDKRMCLVGIVCQGTGSVMHDPEACFDKMKEHWQPVFQGNSTDLDKIREYLEEHSEQLKKWDWAICKPPSLHDVL